MSNSLQPHGLQHLGSFVHHYFLEFAQIHGANHSVTIESVMFSNHLILCCPLLLLPLVFPSIRVFSNESALHTWQPKYWSFSNSPFSEYSGLISFRMDYLISLQSKRLLRVFSSTIIWKHHFFGAQPSLELEIVNSIFFYNSTLQDMSGHSN